ncbi:MAG: hypothetical protein ACFFC7_07025 [Candidatus Hermodarchaeota archaeon]
MNCFKKNYLLLVVVLLGILILYPSAILVRADLFTPTLDGAKSAGEYSEANTYQITFTDHDTKENETGTVYTGRNTSHYHFAFESNYPAGNAEGAVAFSITYGENTPSETQILDRKIVMYFYDLAGTQTWRSMAVDQNEQQTTHIVQNETNMDVVGAGGLSQSKIFLEMSIPMLQTDSEPYDRHLDVDEEIFVILSTFRSYYNATENTEWGYHGISQSYYLTILSDEVTLSKESASKAPGFILSIAGATLVILSVLAKKKRSKREVFREKNN